METIFSRLDQVDLNEFSTEERVILIYLTSRYASALISFVYCASRHGAFSSARLAACSALIFGPVATPVILKLLKQIGAFSNVDKTNDLVMFDPQIAVEYSNPATANDRVVLDALFKKFMTIFNAQDALCASATFREYSQELVFTALS